MFERFTDRARRVLVLAQEEARLLGHGFMGTEHILLGLIHEGQGIAAKTLESLGVTLDVARDKIDERSRDAGHQPLSVSPSPPFTRRAKKVLELSLREAQQLGHNYIGTEHILLGMTREEECVAVQILDSLGTDPDQVRQQVFQVMSGVTFGAGPVAASATTEPKLLACSFCGGRLPPDQLLAGTGAFMCEECIGNWASVHGWVRPEDLGRSSVPDEDGPDDVERHDPGDPEMTTGCGTLLLPSSAPSVGERIDVLASGDGWRIEQILSGRLPSPIDDVLDHEEWVVLLAGGAELELGGEVRSIRAGQWLRIGPGVPHRVLSTEPGTSWVAVHLGAG